MNYSQLWAEEESLLFELGSSIPDNGVIVEIGTAQGGSAVIFHRAAGHRKVHIYSFDIAPSAEAYRNLRDTNVKIIKKPSIEGAHAWKEICSKPIDLLFIDGSHIFRHVFEDFNHWIHYLRPGGIVVFHDYDPIESGGVAHLGVRIMIDSVLRCKLLSLFVHKCRILYGNVTQPLLTRIKGEDYIESLVCLSDTLIDFFNRDYKGWVMVGQNSLSELLRIGLKNGRSLKVVSINEVTPKTKCLLIARPAQIFLQQLYARNISSESIVIVDDLTACYLLAYCLSNKRDELLALTNSRKLFFKWEEALSMLEHAIGNFNFPDKTARLLSNSKRGIKRFSKLIATEQTRLLFLAQLLETFINKKLLRK
jgi:hypothetical protein